MLKRFTKNMKKLYSLIVIALLSISYSFSQGLVITSMDFTKNPQRFANQMVTIKKATLQVNDEHGRPGMITAPRMGAPGPGGNEPAPCNPPKSFAKLPVSFKETPSYHGCFIIAESMLRSLTAQSGGSNIDIDITFKGDETRGYVVTMCVPSK